jgi:hypothetical protein
MLFEKIVESSVAYMEKRTFKRIPANLEFHCFNTDYFGIVTNLSEKGLFIKSKNISFPLVLQFEISIPVKDETLNVLVKINRITKSNGYYDGIGVELLKQPHNYLKFINRLRLALKNQKHPHYPIS